MKGKKRWQRPEHVDRISFLNCLTIISKMQGLGVEKEGGKRGEKKRGHSVVTP